MTNCTINSTHCENCGSTDYEDVHCGDQGYTACCNELIAHDARDCRNHHADDDDAADATDIDAQVYAMYRQLVADHASGIYRTLANHFGLADHFAAVDAVDRHLARR